MEEVLYKSASGNNYLLVSDRGHSYSIYRTIGTMSGKFIDNETLRSSYLEMEINADNIYGIFKDLNILDMDKINLDYFNDYNYLYYKERPYKIRNWTDCSNFIATVI